LVNSVPCTPRSNTSGSFSRTAIRHSLDLAQTVLFLAVVALGGAISASSDGSGKQLGERLMRALVSWQGAALALLSIIAIRLLMAPYWIYRNQEATIEERDQEIAGLAARKVTRDAIDGLSKYRLAGQELFGTRRSAHGDLGDWYSRNGQWKADVASHLEAHFGVGVRDGFVLPAGELPGGYHQQAVNTDHNEALRLRAAATVSRCPDRSLWAYCGRRATSYRV